MCFVLFELERRTQFLADGNMLVLASRDNCLYVYATVEGGRKYSRIGKCTGHSSAVLHVDWSSDSQFLRSNSMDYEILFWTAHNCRQVVNASSMRDVSWATNTCTLAFDVAGESHVSFFSICARF